MAGHRRPSPATTTLVAAAGLFGALLFSPAAPAEVAQKDGVRVSVAGGMNPTRLPRSVDAPVAVSLSGRITATVPGELPRLESIAIAINSHGHLQSRGIPLCRMGRINPSTTQEALLACRSSLVGEGHFSANVKIPEQSPFPSEGKVLAFNGRLRGRPALFAHIYGTKPVPTSYVLPFLVKGTHGTYGTILEASLPDVTGEWGYVTGVSLDLQPRFLSAACPAPAGFPGAVFPLMRTSFGFGEGLKLTSTLTRSCKVRGRSR
jgi:hypothetical protein